MQTTTQTYRRQTRLYPYSRLKPDEITYWLRFHLQCIARIALFGESVAGEEAFHEDRITAIHLEKERRKI